VREAPGRLEAEEGGLWFRESRGLEDFGQKGWVKRSWQLLLQPHGASLGGWPLGFLFFYPLQLLKVLFH